MDNNKNRMRDRPKSNSELRKINPKENADVGIKNGKKIGLHNSEHEKSMGEWDMNQMLCSVSGIQNKEQKTQI